MAEEDSGEVRLEDLDELGKFCFMFSPRPYEDDEEEEEISPHEMVLREMATKVFSPKWRKLRGGKALAGVESDEFTQSYSYKVSGRNGIETAAKYFKSK